MDSRGHGQMIKKDNSGQKGPGFDSGKSKRLKKDSPLQLNNISNIISMSEVR